MTCCYQTSFCSFRDLTLVVEIEAEIELWLVSHEAILLKAGLVEAKARP